MGKHDYNPEAKARTEAQFKKYHSEQARLEGGGRNNPTYDGSKANTGKRDNPSKTKY